MREGHAFVSVGIYVCVSSKKHACLRLTARKSPQKHSLQLLHCTMKTFSVVASLARAANPWLSKATCPCKSTLRYYGCVTHLLSISTSSLSLNLSGAVYGLAVAVMLE